MKRPGLVSIFAQYMSLLKCELMINEFLKLKLNKKIRITNFNLVGIAHGPPWPWS